MYTLGRKWSGVRGEYIWAYVKAAEVSGKDVDFQRNHPVLSLLGKAKIAGKFGISIR